MTIKEIIESINCMTSTIRDNIISNQYEFIEEDYIAMLESIKESLELL